MIIANLEVKSKAPNGVNYTVKGKSAHNGPLTGSVRLLYIWKWDRIEIY